MKQMVIETHHRADTIVKNINDDKTWEYFSIPENRKPLDDARASIDRTIESLPFVKKALTVENLTEMKEKMVDPAVFENNLRGMVDQLGPAVAALRQQCDLVSATYAARQQVFKKANDT